MKKFLGPLVPWSTILYTPVCVANFTYLQDDINRIFSFRVRKPDSYQIHYANIDRPSEDEKMTTVSGVGLTTAFIQNLKASTNYRFWVVPYLNGVAGKKSNELTTKTAVGG